MLELNQLIDILYPTIVITHENCNDGFVSRAIIDDYFKKNDYTNYTFLKGSYTVDYNEYFSNFENCNLILADFSFDTNKIDINYLLGIVKSITIIDHHQSAIQKYNNIIHPKLTKIFDIEKCGAMLTWEYLFTNEDPPILIHFVQDRDLWIFNNPNTKRMHFALNTLSNIEELKKYFNNKLLMEELLVKGQVIEEFVNAQINKNILSNDVYLICLEFDRNKFSNITFSEELSYELNNNIIKYRIPIINITSTLMISDILNVIAEDYFFAIGYNCSENHLNLHFRSNKESNKSANVADIAEIFGGGGHKNSAGANIIFDDLPSNKMIENNLQLLIDQN